MMAAPRLLAGLMPVPVMGMVAKWTKNTANPMGRGAKIYNYGIKKKKHFSIGINQTLRIPQNHMLKNNLVLNYNNIDL